MIRVTVTYPNQPGARFDMNYYTSKHMPLVEKCLRSRGMRGWSVDKPQAGLPPAMQPDFLIQAQIMFDDPAAFQAAMATEGATLMGDIPNFTDIQPRVQVNEVVAAEWYAGGASA
jgi:uncharacterized protein (TIGR02118 family)